MLAEEDLAGYAAYPIDLTATPVTAGTMAVIYGVSAINTEGAEGPIGEYEILKTASLTEDGELAPVNVRWGLLQMLCAIEFGAQPSSRQPTQQA